MRRALVVDDERSLREMMRIMLRKEGFRVHLAETAAVGLQVMDEEVFDLVLTDLRLPDGSGIDLLKRSRELHPETVVMVLTAYASAETAVEALRLGAYDYFIKPFDLDEVRVRIRNAVERKDLQDENRYLRKQLGVSRRFGEMIGSSSRMVEIFDLVPRIASTASTILLSGESGTGKDLLAKAVHAFSPTKNKPFVAVNCAALQDTLIESELFGHVRGAFTGAVTAKKGLFEAADGGTLFLDEIGQTSTSMQVKLLRALQERSIRPVGGTREIAVDVRIIAATNSRLEDLVDAGAFREDLYYRINIIPVRLPPLRERREDIPGLAEHFLQRFASSMAKSVSRISTEALDQLLGYSWPGNVRELEHVIERAVALETSDAVLPERIMLHRSKAEAPSVAILPAEGIDLNVYIEDMTRQLFKAALHRANGVQKRAADLLGISFRSFRYQVAKLGLRKPQ